MGSTNCTRPVCFFFQKKKCTFVLNERTVRLLCIMPALKKSKQSYYWTLTFVSCQLEQIWRTASLCGHLRMHSGPTIGATKPCRGHSPVTHGIQLPTWEAKRVPLRRRGLHSHFLRHVGDLRLREALASILQAIQHWATLTGRLLCGVR